MVMGTSKSMSGTYPYEVQVVLRQVSVLSNPWSVFLTVIVQTLCICLAPTPVLFGLLSISDSVAQSSMSQDLIELLVLPLALIISGVVVFFVYRSGNRVAPILGLGFWLMIILATGVRFPST